MKNKKRWMQAVAAGLALGLAGSGTAFGAGWAQVGKSSWSYQQEDGSYVMDGFSPDGYYIDGSGIWRESNEILGVIIPNRSSFLRASQAGSLADFSADLTTMMDVMADDCGNVRSLSVQDQGISWYRYDSDNESELFSFYKDRETDGYILRLKCSLSRVNGTKPRASWYDYQVMSSLLCRVSAVGPQLAEAVYLSWKEDNTYGLKPGKWTKVGDALVRYDSGSGVGIYRFQAAE